MQNPNGRKFSILTPTRGRPENAIRFANSVNKTAKDKSSFEQLFYVDNDDPRIDDYRRLFPSNHNQVKVIYGEPMSVSKSWNILAEKCVGDVLIMGNDDLVYRTDGWDEILDTERRKYQDCIYVMWFNDGINGARHCAFPIVSRKWYETLGYFAPGIFEFLYNDTWVFDIGKRINRCHYIDRVLTEHLHFTAGKSNYDETYQRARRDGQSQRDRALFENTVHDRCVAADKLNAAIVSHVYCEIGETK